MGLFDAFRKNKKQPDEPAAPEPVKQEKQEEQEPQDWKELKVEEAEKPKQEKAPKPSEQEKEGSVPNEVQSEFSEMYRPKGRSADEADICLSTLMALTKGGRRDSVNSVYYEREDVRVTMLTCKSDRNGARYHSNPMFFITMPNEESLVVERPLGLGDTKNKAVADAAAVLATTLNSAFGCIHRQNVDILENSFDGKVHTYRYPCDFVGYAFGSASKPELGSLFAMIRSEVVDYLGAKKYHWIEMTVTCSNGEVMAYVEINGDRVQALSERLYIKTAWRFTELDNCFYFQTVLMVQDDYTYERRRDNYNAACNLMFRNVRRAIVIMGKSGDVEREQLEEVLEGAVGDSDTAWELMTFLPEIYTAKALGLCCGDMINMKIGKQKLRLNESQLTFIRVIKTEVGHFLKTNNRSETFDKAIFRLSKRYEAVEQSAKNGQAVMIGDIECEAPIGYEIW